MLLKSQEPLSVLKLIITPLIIIFTSFLSVSADVDDSLAYIWPLPAQFTSGNDTLSVDPALYLSVSGKGSGSKIVKEAFERYKAVIFKHGVKGDTPQSVFDNFRKRSSDFDIGTLKIVVHSDNQEVGLFCFCFLFVYFCAKFFTSFSLGVFRFCVCAVAARC